MTKIHILIPCKHYQGAAYLPVGEETSYTGKVYTRYTACPACLGSGNQEAWISLAELEDLLQQQEGKSLVAHLTCCSEKCRREAREW